MTSSRDADPAGLGRGRAVRWLPVLGRPSSTPPDTEPFPVDAGTTPAGFTLRVLLSCRRLTVPALLLAAAHHAGEALVPVLTGLAIDTTLTTGEPARLVPWLLVLGLDFLVLSLTFRCAAQLTAHATQRVQHRLRATVSASVLHPVAPTTRAPDGGVLSTVTNDVGRLSAAVGLGVHPVGELAGIALVAVALLVIHWPLGLVALLGAPVVVWTMGALNAPFARSRLAYQTLLATTVGRATDLVAGHRVVRGVGAEEEAARRYRRASRAALAGARRNIGALGRYLAGSNALSAVFVAGLTGLAGLFAVRGSITVGELIAVAGLTQALLPPLTMLATNAGAVWAAALASGGRVLDLLRAAPPPPPPAHPTPPAPLTPAPLAPAPLAPAPTLEFGLPGLDRVRVGPGELVGLCADDRTAARIAAALLNPHAPDDGARVWLDGRAADHLDDAAYRSRVVVAPHAATLFGGTVADNLDVPGAPPGRRAAALSAAACDDFVPATAAGLATRVGENGLRLSGGQRQRLALARAFASHAPVLVLHDPTTSVDPATEAAIADRLPAVRRGRSTLVIASSPTLLGACDRIVEPPPTGVPHKGVDAP